MANSFVHFELNTPDAARAKQFYGELFGWQFADNDMGGGMIYSTFKVDNGPGGGIMTNPGGHQGWLNYIGVDDVDAATEKAKSLGAQLHVGPHDIPNVGRFSVISDPNGAALALFQPKSS